MQFAAKKLYYKIGEVCGIVGVEPYVLRYWEKEFAALSPPKSKSGQRTYRPKDITLLLTIRKLLYDEGFTIAGARRHLVSGAPVSSESIRRTPRKRSSPTKQAQPKERLVEVREELENILTLLDRG